MTDRTARLLSSIAVGIFASAALATMPLSAVGAADGCLTAPKGVSPAGQHWYYRIDHGTKRHCWFLREEGEASSSSRAAASASPRRTAPAAAATSETTLTHSDADARAEMPPLQGSVEDDPQIAPRTPPVPFIDVGGTAQALPNNAPLEAPQSLVASRWPNSTAVPSSADERPASSSVVVAAANTEATAGADTDADLTSTGTLAAPAAAETTEETPAAGTLASLQTLLLVTLGALMFTGLTGSAVYLLAQARSQPQPYRGPTREPYWLPAPADRAPPPWLEPLAIDPARDAEVRSLEHLTRVSGIEPLLARLANQSQTGQ